MLCATRLVGDVPENRKEGGVAAEVCNSQTGSRFCTLLRDICARIRRYFVRPNIVGEKKKEENPPEVGSRKGHVEHVCKMSGSIS